MLKLATLFLVAIVVLAMVNRWWKGNARLSGPAKPQKCKSCGRFLIGTGPCDCGAPHP